MNHAFYFRKTEKNDESATWFRSLELASVLSLVDDKRAMLPIYSDDQVRRHPSSVTGGAVLKVLALAATIQMNSMKIVIGIVLLLQFASYVLLGWVHFFGNHHPHIPVSFMLMIAVGAFQVLVFLSGAAAWYLARSNRRLLACSLALAVPGLLCLAIAAYFRLSF